MPENMVKGTIKYNIKYDGNKLEWEREIYGLTFKKPVGERVTIAATVCHFSCMHCISKIKGTNKMSKLKEYVCSPNIKSQLSQINTYIYIYK